MPPPYYAKRFVSFVGNLVPQDETVSDKLEHVLFNMSVVSGKNKKKDVYSADIRSTFVE